METIRVSYKAGQDWLAKQNATRIAERRVIDRAMVLVTGYKLGQTDDQLYDMARLTEAVDALDVLLD